MKRSGLVLGLGLALGLTGAANAVPFYTSTVTGWDTLGTKVDNEGDSEWTLQNYDAALDAAGVQLAEEEFATIEWYTVAIDFTTLPGGGITDATYSLAYSGVKTDDEFFASAHLDSTHVGTGVEIMKEIFAYDPATDTIGPLLLTLTSTDGVPDEGTYALTKAIYVVETYTAGPNGELHESSNSFDVVGVPEPGTTALLGLGLAGLGWMRRRCTA